MAESGKKKGTHKKTAAKKVDSAAKKTTKKVVKKAVKKKTTAAKRKTTANKKTVKKRVPAVTPKKTAAKKAASSSARKKTSNTKAKKAPKKITPAKENREITPADEEIDPDAQSRGDDPMSVVDHLDEFRSRIMIILGTLIVLTIVSFTFSEYIIDFLNQPFVDTGKKLNIFKLMGGFIIRLKASAVVALLLTIPLIFFHIWRFIVPAINKDDRRFSRLSLLSAILLFYGGMSFVFFLLVPMAIRVLLTFIPDAMLGTIGADDYMSFVFLFSIAMGILFELPIAVLILTRIGILTPGFLIAKRKYAIVAIFVIAALITPQDPLSQIMVAVPLWFLYEFSIVISRFTLIRKKKRELMQENLT